MGLFKKKTVLFGNLYNTISFSFLSGNYDQLKMSPPTTEQIDEEARGASLSVTCRNVIQLQNCMEFDVSASPDAANQDSKTSTGSDGDGCDISVVATIVGEPSTAIVPEDGQTLKDGQHIGKYRKYFLIYFPICTLKCPPIHDFRSRRNYSICAKRIYV
jgi:hypothetical protein